MAMNELMLLFTCPTTVLARWSTESLAIGLLDLAKRNHWAAWAGWFGDDLLVRVHNADLDTVRSFVAAIARGAAKQSWDLRIVEKSRPAEPLPLIQGLRIPWGTIVQQRLTRELLQCLPAGAVVVSNLRDRYGASVYSREIPAATDGIPALWAEAKAARVHGRLCRVLWSRIDWPFAFYVPLPDAPQPTP